MWRNYFKITVRNLFRNRLHSFILLFGLSISLAACLLILEYVSYELSFDRFHEKSDQIYRVINDRFQNGERVQKGTITYPTIGPTMEQDFAEVVSHSRLFFQSSTVLNLDNELYESQECLVVDEHFFELFDYEVLFGAKDQIMTKAYEVALSESMVKRIYGLDGLEMESLIGQSILADGETDPYTIVAIFADFPTNSLLQADVLFSYPSIIQFFGEGADNSWTFSDFYHFLELAPGTDVAALEAKFTDFSERYFQGQEVSGAEERFYLQPLKEAHLYSADLEYEIGQISNGRTVWAMLLIAFFILLLAWVNYINLSSVRAIERSKEVGVRAVFGAKGRQLITQFVMEAAMINTVAIILAVLICIQVQPWYNQLLESNLSLAFLWQNTTIQFYLLLVFGLVFISGVLLSGFYPAWLLSRQRIPLVLKGQFQQTDHSQQTRKGLVIFQFAASFILIAGSWLVYQQVRFLNQQDLGILTDEMIIVDGPALSNFDSSFIQRAQTFKESLKANPAIEGVTLSSRIPGEAMGRMFNLSRTDDPTGKEFTTNFINVDYNYADTYQLDLVAGKNFVRGDHNINFNLVDQIILNEALVDVLGYESPEAAIGKNINTGNKTWEIKGVLPNFHQKSLHHPIEPIVFRPLYEPSGPMSIKVSGTQAAPIIEEIKQAYTELFPGNNFNYQFLDEHLQEAYIQDRRFGTILGLFTTLAIIIATLGLFGLASYTTSLRTKELSVRRILGANFSDLLFLLSNDFFRLILIAVLVGVPIAWYLSLQWLENFSYHIEIHWWVFLLSGSLAFLLAFIIVGIQALKANFSNPIDALRQ
ncbi:MAG: ABC transporter permease [Saprospiraceae bacterium]